MEEHRLAYNYSAAISFLSGDEQIALKLRDELQRVLPLPVFVYQDRQVELTGKTFEDALSPVFETQSRVVVVLYRSGWGKRGGTLVEYRAVSRRRLRSDERFLYPIVIEHGATRPPWVDDLLYFDLPRYGLSTAVDAIVSLVADHVRDHPSPAANSPLTVAVPQTHPLVPAMREALRAAFVTAPGPFRGYFGASETADDAKRWQSQGGESTTTTQAPKRPYYHTYWGYEAALRLEPGSVSTWASITLEAISSHFGGGRWLKVVREYAFSSGPRKRPELAESVRHTARAAELTHLLAPSHRRTSEVAWDLINEASILQHANGGWREFRDEVSPPALWATVYVHRLLSKLKLTTDGAVPDEREAFLENVVPLLSASEEFLAQQWQEDRWQIEGTVSWYEGTAAVLAEIGHFVSNDSLILDAYYALRSTLTPAGRLLTVQELPGRPPEELLALRIAFGLKSCGRGLAEADSRYRRLVAWLSEVIVPGRLTVYDIAFAAMVLDLRTEAPNSSQTHTAVEQGDAAGGASSRS